MSRTEHLSEVERKDYQKVNQVIQVPIHASKYSRIDRANRRQNFFTKAALTIISSRTLLPPIYNSDGEVRQNKWVCICPSTLSLHKANLFPVQRCPK
jgi:autophagy-related protein 13